MKTVIKAVVLNGRPAWIKKDSHGNYWATVSGITKKAELFGDAVRHVEKTTGVNYPF